MEFRKEALSVDGVSMQPGLFLQTIQFEQSYTDRARSPIGQTSMHILHSVHFSLSIFNADLPSNLTHDIPLSISRQFEGHILIHLTHFMGIGTQSIYISLC